MSAESAISGDGRLHRHQPELARKALELLEDQAMRAALGKVDPTQMRTVLSALDRAGSYAEAEIILRYQSARLRDKWDDRLVEKLLALFREADRLGVDGDTHDHELSGRAIARQFGLIVRVHRVAAEAKEGKR